MVSKEEFAGQVQVDVKTDFDIRAATKGYDVAKLRVALQDQVSIMRSWFALTVYMPVTILAHDFAGTVLLF